MNRPEKGSVLDASVATRVYLMLAMLLLAEELEEDEEEVRPLLAARSAAAVASAVGATATAGTSTTHSWPEDSARTTCWGGHGEQGSRGLGEGFEGTAAAAVLCCALRLADSCCPSMRTHATIQKHAPGAGPQQGPHASLCAPPVPPANARMQDGQSAFSTCSSPAGLGTSLVAHMHDIQTLQPCPAGL